MLLEDSFEHPETPTRELLSRPRQLPVIGGESNDDGYVPQSSKDNNLSFIGAFNSPNSGDTLQLVDSNGGPEFPRVFFHSRLPRPLTFNHVPPLDGSDPCQWCEEQHFGLTQPIESTKTIIQDDDRLAIHGTRHGVTRMCHSCTTTRLFICLCPEHSLEPIEHMDPKSFDFDSVLRILAKPNPISSAAFAWCSICPSPAFYTCRASAIFEDLDQGLSGKQGCGLQLCSNCAAAMVSEYDGSLTELITLKEEDTEIGILDLRPDANLLKQNGYLMCKMGF
jgi:hypothetical protein